MFFGGLPSNDKYSIDLRNRLDECTGMLFGALELRLYLSNGIAMAARPRGREGAIKLQRIRQPLPSAPGARSQFHRYRDHGVNVGRRLHYGSASLGAPGFDGRGTANGTIGIISKYRGSQSIQTFRVERKCSMYLDRFSERLIFPLVVLTNQPSSTSRTSPHPMPTSSRTAWLISRIR